MFSPRPRRAAHRPASLQQGYILITLILFVALLAISIIAMAPLITQQIKRDREDELIHRGVQYTRAIKRYVKKFGRYPTKIEDLESTNNMRFLRQRYKDPITGKDFKILRMGDVQISFGGGIQGAVSASNLAGASGNGNNSNSAFGGGSAFGGSSFGGNAFGGGPGGGSTFGGGSFGGSSFGGNQGGFGGNSFGGSSFIANNSGSVFGGSNSATASSNPSGQTQTSDNGSDAASNNGTGTQGGFGQPLQSLGGFGQQGNANGQNNQVFGGGPIVGVASTSKDKSIRIYNKKDKYYQWQFIYDPSTDRGGLLTTPNQPGMQQTQTLQSGAQNSFGAQNGTQSGFAGSPFGGFGNGPQGPATGFQPQQPAPQQPQLPQMPPDQGPQ